MTKKKEKLKKVNKQFHYQQEDVRDLGNSILANAHFAHVESRRNVMTSMMNFTSREVLTVFRVISEVNCIANVVGVSAYAVTR